MLTETDLHPLPSQDPSGLAAFYLTIGATILGFVTTFQLRANARPMPLPPWLAFTGGLAILGSLVLIAVVKGVLHALPVPFFDGWGVVALQMIAATAVASLMATLIGRWAIIPTWLIFVVLGNTSSGGAVSPALLPEPYQLPVAGAALRRDGEPAAHDGLLPGSLATGAAAGPERVGRRRRGRAADRRPAARPRARDARSTAARHERLKRAAASADG